MSDDQSLSRLSPDPAPARVVVAGGGVAAVETLLALRDLAGDRVATTLVAPEPTFSRGRQSHLDLAELADELVCDRVAAVEPGARRIRCAGGEEIGYDHLVLAVGARARPAWRHGITLGVDPAEEALPSLIDELERGCVTQVAFVVPAGMVWPLPLYELAVMTARQAWSMGLARVRFVLVTPEERPLGVFGRAPSEAIGALLDGCGIEFIGSTYACVGLTACMPRGTAPPSRSSRAVSRPSRPTWLPRASPRRSARR